MPRKQAFSGKQKKKQLQERRERKKDMAGRLGEAVKSGEEEESECSKDKDDVKLATEERRVQHGQKGRNCSHGISDDDLVQELPDDTAAAEKGLGHAQILHVHQQPVKDKVFDPNRFRLHFVKMGPEEVKKGKKTAMKPTVKVTEKELEMSVESVHMPDAQLDFPKRPPWDFSLSKSKLEQQEQDYFVNYLHTILTSHNPSQLSYFELNLETWRQLWRVLEISDVLLLIADVLHLPPALYRHLREELKREVILVLNKVDLVAPALVSAWHHYLHSQYPEAHIVCFSVFPSKPLETGAKGLQSQQTRRRVRPLGPQQLLDVCRLLVKDKVNLHSWQHKLDTDDFSTSAPERQDSPDDIAPGDASSSQSQTSTAESLFAGVYKKFKDDVLTIGCIGYPNAGKSSLLNGLVGRKVVSVSKTPGHTKHLQTIYLTPTVRLCDCPGLVFPSYVDKSLQILSGIFPIAQVREPYSAVGYLAQRLDLPALLRLPHPESAGRPTASRHRKELLWSAFDVCEGWAIKNGFYTAKAARPDVYRAANHILRMAVEGRLRLCLAPPGFFGQQDRWEADPFTQTVTRQLDSLAQSRSTLAQAGEEVSESDSDTMEQADMSSSNSSEEGAAERAGCVDRNPFAVLSDH